MLFVKNVKTYCRSSSKLRRSLFADTIVALQHLVICAHTGKLCCNLRTTLLFTTNKGEIF